MAKRMLIDAAHPEETRVVVLNGNRLEEFDFESSTKKQVKGNIYLAKVTRVEPSLQAAFVEYSGNRHGFLAFSEIHPDYYRIPVGDRGGGRAANGGGSAAEIEDDAGDEGGVPLAAALPEEVAVPPSAAGDDSTAEPAAEAAEGEATERETVPADAPDREPASGDSGEIADAVFADPWEPAPPRAPEPVFVAPEPTTEPAAGNDTPPAATTVDIVAQNDAHDEARGDDWPAAPPFGDGDPAADHDAPAAAALRVDGDAVIVADEANSSDADAAETIETVGGDELEDSDGARQRSRAMRHYKIQEVIKRRQIMLVQVTKEERGNKGAALTTYLSLAGRYCVLMPNTNRGGGVSRKIVSTGDRRRLKEMLAELDIPDGMGVIVRTAGSERSKPEVKRDYEYLLRLWNEIRELTLRSTAPAVIYEEGNLIKRAIRDLYSRDIDEVLVEGDEGYRTAKAFMKMLMPSHAKRVQPYRDPQIGLLHRFQVESQIDAIHSPVAQLRSGGYVVINQTEALVAIDVNSGRSTRERNIEETALRTNLEAADEIARHLRLRDLAGLIVIDFIDMEEHRNQGAVERRLKEALKNDRARIQVGRISPFGLLEMSRQRLRPSLAETSTQPCPHCGGSGLIRSIESTALYVLRSIEEEGIRRRSAEICLYVPTAVALYILNQKRDSLAQIEQRYAIRVVIANDDTLIPPNFRLDRVRNYAAGEAPPPIAMAPLTQAAMIDDDEADDDDEAEPTRPVAATEDGDDERGRRRRRRRRRRGDDEREAPAAAPAAAADTDAADAVGDPAAGDEPAGDDDGDGEPRRRRRGRRGGRRRPRRDGEAGPADMAGSPDAAASPETVEFSEPAEWPDPVAHPATTDTPYPAAEKIEIVPVEPDEDVAAAAALPAAWAEPAPAPAALETASLPALAGEAAEPAPAYADAAAAAVSAEGPAEAAAVAAASPVPVQAVTDPPANPRKGWWQRLVQS